MKKLLVLDDVFDMGEDGDSGGELFLDDGGGEESDSDAELAKDIRSLSDKEVRQLAAQAYYRTKKDGIDIGRMAAAVGLTKEQIVTAVGGELIFQDPEAYDRNKDPYKNWISREAYLKGNVRQKLHTAELYDHRYRGRFQKNIDALKEHCPPWLPWDHIYAPPGFSGWRKSDHIAFLKSLLDLTEDESDSIVLRRDEEQARIQNSSRIWTLQAPDLKYNKYNIRTYGVAEERQSGRKKRWEADSVHITAVEIYEHLLNGVPVRVTRKVIGKGGAIQYVTDRELTQTANGKKEEILKKFEEFIRDNRDLQIYLEEVYNNTFCQIGSVYDSSPKEHPGLSEAFVPFAHQERAVDHFKCLEPSESLLINHEVGSGKTAIIAIGAMERLQTGISNRVLLVSPNNVAAGTAAMIRELYPGSRVFLVMPDQVRPQVRDRTFGLVMAGEYDICIMAQSIFDRINMSKEYHLEKLKEQRNVVDAKIASLRSSDYAHSRYKTLRKKLIEKLEKLRNSEEDPWGFFEKLGVDLLIVDEAHTYKNVSHPTSMSHVVGMHQKGSHRCDEMLEKTAYTQNKGGNVVFATGTLISNSMVDLYAMMKYLMPTEMKLYKIFDMGQWMNLFTRTTTEFEVSPDGESFEFKEKITSFQNIPELVRFLNLISETFFVADELKQKLEETGGETMEEEDLPLFELEDLLAGDPGAAPEKRSGEDLFAKLPVFQGYTDVVIERSPLQTRGILLLQEMNEELKDHLITRKDFNSLVLVQQGRALALDPKLFVAPVPAVEWDPFKGMEPEEGEKLAAAMDDQDRHPSMYPGKIQRCADEVTKVYRENPGRAQLVFCDIGTPKTDAFNAYDELKMELMDREIPAGEIAYIHEGTTESKRKVLLDQVNRGQIRVMIGSTQKLGVGVNVQENLVAIHHLSIPWRPSDLQQREGRILRQGNTCPEVMIFRYVTTRTFDTYSWQILERKARFIAQFQAGTLSEEHRSETDVEDLLPDYGEIKALCLGDGRIRRRVELANQLEKLKVACRHRRKELEKAEEEARKIPERIRRKEKLAEQVEEDHAYYESFKEKLKKDDRRSFGEELLYALHRNDHKNTESYFGEYQAFRVMLPANMAPEDPFVYVVREGGGRYRVGMNTDKPFGVTQRLDHVLEHLPDRKQEHEEDRKRLERDLEAVLDILKNGNPHEEQVLTLEAELWELDEELRIAEQQ